MNYRINLSRTLKYFTLAIMALLTVIPVWLILIGALKEEGEIYTNLLGLPKAVTFQNYISAWIEGNFGIYYKNSIILTIFTVIFTMLLSCLAAFALSRKDLFFRRIIYFVFVIGLTVPAQVALMPLFMQIKSMGLYNTLSGVVIIFIGYRIAFTTFIIYSFMKNIPVEIEESAKIDGCSIPNLFINIVLPLSKNVIGVGVIFNIVYAWNNFFFPLVFISNNNLKPLPTGLLAFKGENTVFFTKLFAGISIITIPIVLVYVILQKYFVQGITAGSIKG